MKLALYQVDAFTNQVFKGNPAAVCPLDHWLPDDLLQQIASENNLSETAFFVKHGAAYQLRWFTPSMEVDLCGHATLASAHVLFNHMDFKGISVTFTSQSGELIVSKEDSVMCLDFPSRPGERCAVPNALIEGLGHVPREVLKARDYMAIYDHEDDVAALQPDFERLRSLDTLGIIVTARGKSVDFVSRFFAPGAGIDEDPVTGSAHCTLIPYWANTLKKQKLTAKQISKRTGELFCDNLDSRVHIAGQAVTYLEGTINL